MIKIILREKRGGGGGPISNYWIRNPIRKRRDGNRPIPFTKRSPTSKVIKGFWIQNKIPN